MRDIIAAAHMSFSDIKLDFCHTETNEYLAVH